MIKFSIIIPVHNAERFLCKCLRSLQQQTFSMWEAICVDDGSSDSSLAILTRFSAEDSRIITIHQNQSGVSHARNVALSHVQGEWVLMVDSDDTLDVDLLERLNSHIENVPGVEILGFGWSEIDNKTDSKIRQVCCGAEKMYVNDVLKSLDVEARKYVYCVWNKCYKTNLLQRAEIKFAEGVPLSEDYSFSLRALNACNSFSIMPEIGYYYRKHGNQTMSKISLDMVYLQYRNIVDCIDNWKSFPKNGMVCSIELMFHDLLITNRFVSDFDHIELIDRLLNMKEFRYKVLQWGMCHFSSKLRILCLLMMVGPKWVTKRILAIKRRKVRKGSEE